MSVGEEPHARAAKAIEILKNVPLSEHNEKEAR